MRTSPSSAPARSPFDVLRLYLRLARARPRDMFPTLALIALGGAFEGITFGMLIPLTRAMAEGGFGFLENSPVLGSLLRFLPEATAGGGAATRTVVVFILAVIVLSRLGYLLTDYVRARFLHSRTEAYRARITSATFERVLGFGRLYFSGRAMGELDTEIGWAASAPELLNVIEDRVQCSVRLGVMLTVMLALSVPLTLAFVVTAIIAFRLLEWIRRCTVTLVERVAEVERHLRREVLDLLLTVPLVKAHSQEVQAARAHAAIRERARALALERQRIADLHWPLSEAIILGSVLFAQAVVILASDSFALADLGQFAAFLLLLQQTFPSVGALARLPLVLAEHTARLTAVGRLFDDAGKYFVTAGDVEFTGLTREIRIQGLSFAYGPSAPVLKDVEAVIPAGRTTALVGETGSGKTTLVDLLVRFYDVPPGTILLDGRDIRDFSVASLHARIALVSQQTWLLNRSLRENLCYGLDSRPADGELEALLADLALGPFLARLPAGLDTEIGDRGVRLSGGQRQRIEIARALLRDPDILILDEATSALDVAVEQRVLAAVERWTAGRTLIVIAHRLSTVRTADRVLVLRDGMVAEAGTWNELLAIEDGHLRSFHALT
jgi:ATP-binding cassette, subfamily B, bacterial MsbA